jgi:hypothetical protein
MCVGGLFSSPSTPSLPPPPPPPTRAATARQPRLADEGVRKAQEDVEGKAKRFAGLRGGTLLTGSGGLQTQASGQKKVLLG